MFCTKCGKELRDNDKFCNACGAPVKQVNAAAAEPVSSFEPVEDATVCEPQEEATVCEPVEVATVCEPVEEVTVEEPAAFEQVVDEAPSFEEVPEVDTFYDTPVSEPAQEYAAPEVTPVNDQTSFVDTAFDEQPDTGKKGNKKKKKLWKLIPAIGIPAAIAALVALNWQTVLGFALKTFGSEASYLFFVESQAFQGYSDDITKAYDSVLVQSIGQDQSAEMELSLNVGDNALALVESQLGEDIPLDWVEDISLVFDTTIKSDKQALSLGLELSGERILTLDTITDMAEQEMYMALLELSEDYLVMDLSDTYDYETAMLTSFLNESLEDFLIDEQVVNDLLVKYSKIALENIEDVEKDSKTLKINGVSQKCTVLEFDVDQKLILNMASDVLKEAKNDKEIKKIIKQWQDALVDAGMISGDADLYETFVEEVEYAIDNIKEVRSEIDNQTLITIKDYVDGKHNVIGREFEIADAEESLFYAYVQDGDKIAFEASMGDYFELAGSGTEKKELINIDLELLAYEEEVITLEVKNFDSKAYEEKGALNGEFTLRPSEMLLEELAYESGLDNYASLLDPAIELICKSTETSSDVSLNILNEDEVFIGLNLAAKLKNAEKIDTPSDAYDITDEDEILMWVEDWDYDAIVNNLKKTDLPDEFIELAEMFFNQLETELSYVPNYDNSYDYDYDYDMDAAYDDSGDYYF